MVLSLVISSVEEFSSATLTLPATLTVSTASATLAGSKRTIQPVAAWCWSSLGFATPASNWFCSAGASSARTGSVSPWVSTAGASAEASR